MILQLNKLLTSSSVCANELAHNAKTDPFQSQQYGPKRIKKPRKIFSENSVEKY